MHSSRSSLWHIMAISRISAFAKFASWYHSTKFYRDYFTFIEMLCLVFSAAHRTTRYGQPWHLQPSALNVVSKIGRCAQAQLPRRFIVLVPVIEAIPKLFDHNTVVWPCRCPKGRLNISHFASKIGPAVGGFFLVSRKQACYDTNMIIWIWFRCVYILWNFS